MSGLEFLPFTHCIQNPDHGPEDKVQREVKGHLPPLSLEQGLENWKKAVLQETQQEVKFEHSFSWLVFLTRPLGCFCICGRSDCHTGMWMHMYVDACGVPVPKCPTQNRHVTGEG